MLLIVKSNNIHESRAKNNVLFNNPYKYIITLKGIVIGQPILL